MLIVGGAMCLFRCYNIVYIWVGVFWGPEDIFSMVTHVLGIYEL